MMFINFFKYILLIYCLSEQKIFLIINKVVYMKWWKTMKKEKEL